MKMLRKPSGVASPPLVGAHYEMQVHQLDVGNARRMMTTDGLNAGPLRVTHFLWVDDDMEFLPETNLEPCLQKALEPGTGFVSANWVAHDNHLVRRRIEDKFVPQPIVYTGGGMVFNRKIAELLVGLPRDPAARHFAIVVLLAFLPAAAIGVVAHGFIKSVLFSPWVVAVSLIVGGIAILLIERARPQPVIHAIEQLPLGRALAIGFLQCLAMIPGVSRSGATIIGALLLGVDRRTAAEFSFFLAIPTMFGATVYDLYKNRGSLTLDGGIVIAVGFAAAFVTALFVVRAVIGFVARHGFAPFAWYRIGAGSLVLLWLALR
jgi:undecaprenyl-diphosphatase